MRITDTWLEKFVWERGTFTARRSLFGAAVAVACGALLGLAFPTLDWWPLAWICLAPLYVVACGVTAKRAWAYGFLAGMSFWLVLASWMSTFHPLSLVTAVPALALYFSLPFAALALWRRFLPERFWWLRPAVFTVAWLAAEYFRCTGFLGYAWGVIGYSQYTVLPVIQVADLGGVWAVSLLLVLANAMLGEWILARAAGGTGARPALVRLGLPAALVVLSLAYGAVRLAEPVPPGQYRMALVQGFTDPATDWTSEERTMRTIAKIESLSARAAATKPDLVVWSETLFARRGMYYARYYKDLPDTVFEKRVGQWFAGIAKKLSNDMLLTAPDRAVAVRSNAAGRAQQVWESYNSAFFFTGDGTLRGEYRKINLVPFGEWFPFKKQFPWIAAILEKTIASNFTPGEVYTVFRALKAAFSAVICFEDIFGDLCRRFVLAGADFLINTTNDYWSRSVRSQEQHFAISVFRAVENRRYLVRAANTGVTCVVDAWGRVKSRLPNHEIGILEADVPLLRDRGTSLYTRWGDWLAIPMPWLLGGLFFGGWGLGIARRRAAGRRY